MLSTHFVCCDDSSLARSKEALHCCYQVTSIICHLVYLAGPCSRLMLPRGALRPRINILDYMIAFLPSRILQVVFYVQTCRTHPLPRSMRSAQTHQRSITLSLPRQNLLLTAHAKQGFLRASAASLRSFPIQPQGCSWPPHLHASSAGFPVLYCVLVRSAVLNSLSWGC